jgi:hypothetical protein
MRAFSVTAPSVIVAALFVGCAGGSSKPPSDPPPAPRSFTRPAANPKAAIAAFAEHARSRGCSVEELSTGAIAHCPDAMIAVEPRGADLLIECREKPPEECGPIYDTIVSGTAPVVSASVSASASASESVAPPPPPAPSATP